MNKYTKSLLFLGFMSSFATLASCTSNITKKEELKSDMPDKNLNDKNEMKNNKSSKDKIENDKSQTKENEIESINEDRHMQNDGSQSKENEIESINEDRHMQNDASQTKENEIESINEDRHMQNDGSKDNEKNNDRLISSILFLNLRTITSSVFTSYSNENDFLKYKYVREAESILSKIVALNLDTHKNEIEQGFSLLKKYKEIIENNKIDMNFVDQILESSNVGHGHADYSNFFKLLDNELNNLLKNFDYNQKEFRAIIIMIIFKILEQIIESNIDYTYLFEIEYQLNHYGKDEKNKKYSEEMKKIYSIVSKTIELKGKLTKEEFEKINDILSDINSKMKNQRV
ncbi:hypothetical protein KQ876_03035 [Mycoplasma sp. CSL7491-lung]|uniref:hypothetical protein n=1 Tax=Mycoplasma sp. CSL7491-lung TaxID=549718 RepID=UPI001C0FD1AC|nr:hypothetical protein [Mycoplasma sp. CSL7491-lung]MBU4693170.1 hypothetical protein [Mycoplasma sp. CSL7491-lung]